MLRINFFGKVGLFLGLFLFTAFGVSEAADQPLEKTWIRTKQMATPRDSNLEPQNSAANKIPVNRGLLKKLNASGPAPKTAVRDAESCLALLKPLDKTRKAVQREGGAWSMFERSALIRPHSNNGMQIDSNLNKLVFALRHLCKTAHGVPLNPLALGVNEVVKKMGKAKAREYLIEVEGEAPKDVDLWLEYTEFANKNATRKVSYREIQALIQKTAPLMNLYMDLENRKVNESNKDVFLSDSLTLLTAIKSRLTDEPSVAMAMKEDVQAPLHTRWDAG